jgi:hypothetical protein
MVNEAETGCRYRCAVCGKILDNGYSLVPETTEEWDTLYEKFGDVSHWLVGQCCFGGYCGPEPKLTPTLFFEDKIKQLPDKI